MTKRLSPGPYMEKGSAGLAVVVLQTVIKIALGKTVAKLGFEITGVFDKGTERAIRHFQRVNGLEIDGKCGPATRKAIFKETRIDLNRLLADIFSGETVTVPPTAGQTRSRLKKPILKKEERFGFKEVQRGDDLRGVHNIDGCRPS